MVGDFPVALRLGRTAKGPEGNLGRSTRSEFEGSQTSKTNNIDRAIFASFEYRSRRNRLARLIKRINLAKNSLLPHHRLSALL
jgi:hypothetical protein